MKYKPGYSLNVGEPIKTQDGYVYIDKDDGKKYTGWYHCGCCGRDGFASTRLPVCTGCANKAIHGLDDSPIDYREIQEYCLYFGTSPEWIK